MSLLLSLLSFFSAFKREELSHNWYNSPEFFTLFCSFDKEEEAAPEAVLADIANWFVFVIKSNFEFTFHNRVKDGMPVRLQIAKFVAWDSCSPRVPPIAKSLTGVQFSA